MQPANDAEEALDKYLENNPPASGMDDPKLFLASTDEVRAIIFLVVSSANVDALNIYAIMCHKGYKTIELTNPPAVLFLLRRGL